MYGLKKRSKQDESGLIKGAGTGTSDDIKKNVPAGSYIMPADSTEQIGTENLKNMGSPTPVNLSNGEFQLSPDQVHSLGVQTLDAMKDRTHMSVDQPQLGFKSGQKKPELFFANGGLVSAYPSADDIRKARRDTNVPSATHAQDFVGRQTAQQAGGQVSTRGQTFEGQARNVTPESQPRNVTTTPALPPPPTAGGNQSFLARAGSKALGAAKGLGVLHGIGSMVSGAVDGFNTSTEDYATRMGLDPNADRGEFANFGIRTAGVLSDVGNAATFGQLGKRFDDKNLNQAKADFAEQQQRFAAINAQRDKTPAGTVPPPATVAPTIDQQMNTAMYGQDTVQGQQQTPSNDPFKIQQNGNSFSYANPGAAAHARADGIREGEGLGFKVRPANDPKGVANFMQSTREMGPSEQQIQNAFAQREMNMGMQGFGGRQRQIETPQRTDAQEAERQDVIRAASKTIKGANGLTANQMRILSDLQQGDDNRANQRYTTDANNQASLEREAMGQAAQNYRTELSEQGTNSRFNANLGFDAQKFKATNDLANREFNLNATEKGFGIRNAGRVEKLNEMYDKAETDEQRQSIQQRINRLTGAKDQNGKDRYMTVGGGQEYNKEEGVMINRPQQIFDTQTGRLMNMDGTPVGGQGSTVDNSQFDNSTFKNGQVYQDKNTGQYFRWDEKSQRQIPVQQ